MNKILFNVSEIEKLYKILYENGITKIWLRGIKFNSKVKNIDDLCKEHILCEEFFFEDGKIDIKHLKYLRHFSLIEDNWDYYNYYICYFEENIKFDLHLEEYIDEVKKDQGIGLISSILNLSINQIRYLEFNSFSLEEKKYIINSILDYKLKAPSSGNPILDDTYTKVNIDPYEERKAKLLIIKNEIFNYIEENDEIEIEKNMEPSIAKFLFYKSIIIAEKKLHEREEILNDEYFLQVVEKYGKIEKILREGILKKEIEDIDTFFYMSHFRRMIYFYINILSLLKEIKKGNKKIKFEKSTNESKYLNGSKKISYDKIKDFLEVAEVEEENKEKIDLIRKFYENYLKERILITNPKLIEKVKLEYNTKARNIYYFSDKAVEKIVFIMTEKFVDGELYVIINKNEEYYMGKYSQGLSTDKGLYFSNENGFPKFKVISHENISLIGKVRKLILEEQKLEKVLEDDVLRLYW